MVARAAPDRDDRLARQDPQPRCPGAVRPHPGRDGPRLHVGVGVPHDPPLPAGAGGSRPRGGRPRRPDHGSSRRRGRPMTDVGYILAAYGVIFGGLALYTVTLWR